MKKTKIVTLLLVLVMILSAFASCGPEDTGENEGSTPSSSPTASSTPEQSAESSPETSEESSTQNLQALLPPKMELNKDMNIFVGTLYYDEWLDKDDGDIVGTEIFNRISRTEDHLGVELFVDRVPGKGTDRETILDEVKKRHESTDPNVIAHAVSTYSQFAGAITLEGRYHDISESDAIDLDNPWWPKYLVENSTIDGRIFFVSGDISPTLIYETYAIFFNTGLLAKYGITENPIDLVNNNEWTLDKVIELTSGIYDDNDGITGLSENDLFAFNFNDNAHLKAFPFAMGIRVIIPDETEGYVYSPTYLGDKMEIIADKISDWFEANPGVNNSNEIDLGYNTFKRGNCLFTVGNFAYAAFQLSAEGIEYGVVPCPLYDKEQTDYYSYYGNPTSFWGILNNVDIDDSATLIEYLAADGYVYITPMLFERALKYKYVTGDIEGLSHMFDIIREGLVFDACMFYKRSIGTAYNEFNELASPMSSWIGQFSGFKLNSMKGALKGVVSKLRAIK